MGRKGVEIAEAVLREIDGKNYIGRLLSHDRTHVRSLADELRSFGIPARMVQLPDSEFGLPSRFVLVVMADDEMSAEELTMWKRKAPERGLKFLSEIAEMEFPSDEPAEPETPDDESDDELDGDTDPADAQPDAKPETPAERRKRVKAEKAAAKAANK